MPDPRFYLRRSLSLILVVAAAQAEHRIDGISFRQYDGGPPWPAGYSPRSGDTVCLEFRLAGLATKEGDFDDHFGYEYEVQALDEQRRQWAAAARGKVEGLVTEEDKKSGWRPKVSACFETPPLLGPRQFQLAISVQDLITGRRVERAAPFRLRGPNLSPSPSLAVQQFRFLRQEEDFEPLAVAAYRAGDPLWARFEMTGFAVAADGRVDVAYGLEVFDAAGKKLFALPIAAEETRQFRYPPDYLPGIVSLNLQPGTPAGEYIIQLTVLDRSQATQSVTRHTFRIE